MTLTVNSDCTEILINSELFSITNSSNILSIKVNGGTALEVVLLSNITSYTLTPGDLDLTTFTEGVYDITLTSVLLDNSVATDQGCAYVLCDLLCQDSTLLWYSDKTQIEKVLALEGIKAAANCETCSCSLMLTLFNSLSNDTTTSCGCGCS